MHSYPTSGGLLRFRLWRNTARKPNKLLEDKCHFSGGRVHVCVRMCTLHLSGHKLHKHQGSTEGETCERFPGKPKSVSVSHETFFKRLSQRSGIDILRKVKFEANFRLKSRNVKNVSGRVKFLKGLLQIPKSRTGLCSKWHIAADDHRRSWMKYSLFKHVHI